MASVFVAKLCSLSLLAKLANFDIIGTWILSEPVFPGGRSSTAGVGRTLYSEERCFPFALSACGGEEQRKACLWSGSGESERQSCSTKCGGMLKLGHPHGPD